MINQKISVITGCSTGIGLNVALQLSQNTSYKVIATLRTPSKTPKPLAESKCDIQQLDVTDDASCYCLSSYIAEQYGGCDVLINNAGFGVPGNLEAVSVADAKRVFDVNVWGVMRMCRLLAPQMRKRGGGLILTVSSLSGIRGHPFIDVYAASKKAVEGLLESYRYSVESDNIKVVLVNPGPTTTPFTIRLASESSLPTDTDDINRYWMHKLVQSLNNGEPVEECAREIVRVVERDIDKSIIAGKDAVRFWNPTSDVGYKVLDSVLKSPDGYSGVYADKFRVARQTEEEWRHRKNIGHQTK